MQLNCMIHIITSYFLINDHEIYWNHVIEAKSDNKDLGKKWVKKICEILSARIQLEN